MSEIQRKDWDKIAGAALIVTGIVVAVLGGSILYWEDLRHLIGSVRGPRST